MLRTLLAQIRDRLTGTSKTIHHMNELARKIDHIDKNIQSLIRHVSLLRETSRDTKNLNIVFLFQSPETWSSIATVYEACSKDPRIEQRIVLLPFYQGSNDNLEKNRNFLQKEQIPFIEFSNYNLEWDNPDVIFLQNPYDSTRPASFSAENIVSHQIKVAYIPYGLEVGGGAENLRWQYDLPTQRKAWRIFARSEDHKAMFARYCQNGDKHVVVTGHPKTDRFSTNRDFEVDSKYKQICEGKKTILWTPHFSVKSDGWSTYPKFGQHIFSIFADQDDLVLIFRPHPLFFPFMRDNCKNGHLQEAEIRKMISERPNVILDEYPDYRHAFHLSSGLMADAGSFLLEYLPTKKPILYLENPSGPGLNEQGRVTRSYYRGAYHEDIDLFIRYIITDKDPMKGERLSEINKIYYKIDGLAGERIKNYLIENLAPVKTKDERLAIMRTSSPENRPKFDPSSCHMASHNFWKNCSCSYLAADPTYYDRQERELRERFLPAAGKIRTAMDIGCGDGRFSMVISEYADHTIAFDLSGKLIAKAIKKCKRKNLINIDFQERSIESGLPDGEYCLVSCMGIASTIIDETIWTNLCNAIEAHLKPNGYLLSKESLCEEEDVFLKSDSYVTLYRSEKKYKQMLEQRGFKLIDKCDMARDKNIVNSMFLWQKSMPHD